MASLRLTFLSFLPFAIAIHSPQQLKALNMKLANNKHNLNTKPARMSTHKTDGGCGKMAGDFRCHPSPWGESLLVAAL
jgi:hypothetical protein